MNVSEKVLFILCVEILLTAQGIHLSRVNPRPYDIIEFITVSVDSTLNQTNLIL